MIRAVLDTNTFVSAVINHEFRTSCHSERSPSFDGRVEESHSTTSDVQDPSTSVGMTTAKLVHE